MSFSVESLHGSGFQVEDPAGHWVIFTLDDLRSHSCILRPGMVEGSPPLSDDKANLFVWADFVATRGNAIENGLIPDDLPFLDPERTHPRSVVIDQIWGDPGSRALVARHRRPNGRGSCRSGVLGPPRCIHSQIDDRVV